MGRPEYHDAARSPSRMVGRAELLAREPGLASIWEAADASFPIRVTRSFWRRLQRAGAPLARQVLPSAAELREEGLEDPVGDAACSPIPWIVHKYPARVLWMLTKRCHLHCRYCFRRGYDPAQAADPSPEQWEAALDYIRRHAPREVILSGGDPLCIRNRKLFAAIDAVRECGARVRVHSRAPISAPHRVSSTLAEGLARRHAWLVLHANHPAELDAEVDAGLERLRMAGVRLLNQSVLLRGVNDDPELLAQLCEGLLDRGVRPYYLHHPDAVRGATHFGLSRVEGLAIYRELRRRVSGLALPRYVVDPPDGSGKIDVMDLAAPITTGRR